MLTLTQLPPIIPLACGNCTVCCREQVVIASESWGDDLSLYGSEHASEAKDGMKMLIQRPNGDCVYLDRATGCTIYETRPVMCRAFNCVELGKSHGSAYIGPALAYAARRVRRHGVGSAVD